MPYIGINDKHDNKIFLRDIIKCKFYNKEILGVVDFENGCFYLKCNKVSDNQFFVFEDLEIIGNIYKK